MCSFILFSSWGIAALQCCTTKWTEYMRTCIPFLWALPLPHDPGPLSQQGQPSWAPRPHRDSPGHISVLLARLIPPSLLPHVHQSILYIWVSIPALQIGSSAPFFYIKRTCINIWYLFYFPDISLCVTDSRSIHIYKLPNSISFLCLSTSVLFMCITSLFIPLLMDI